MIVFRGVVPFSEAATHVLAVRIWVGFFIGHKSSETVSSRAGSGASKCLEVKPSNLEHERIE